MAKDQQQTVLTKMMKNLLTAIKWDIKLLHRHGLISVAGIITLLYIVLLYYFREQQIDALLLTLIFSDPVALGFIFIGAMLLFEKNANTIQAIIVNPLQKWQYLWSKAISLTIIALPMSILMAIAGHTGDINFFYLSFSVILTSVIFVFLGVAGAVRVKTFNQYILVFPVLLVPLSLPLICIFGIDPGNWMYLLPTYGSVLLMQASLSDVAPVDIAYAIVYLILFMVLTYRLASYFFNKYIVQL